jgi:molybdopterin-guanine dinucleotide biosynthesis protein A
MPEVEPLLAAVVLAGRSPDEEDLLARYSQGRTKALIPIAGRPMITYVIEALAGCRYMQRIVVVGLPPEERSGLSIPADHVPDQGDMLANAEAGIRHAVTQLPELTGVLISGADLPLLTPAVVDQFVEGCIETDHDLYYGVVERSVMEGRFPTSRRTYVRLADGEFAGGDLILVGPGVAAADRELWRRLSSARKNPVRQARMLGGPWPLIRLLSGRMSLREGERWASRALRLRGRAVICPCPEVGMDVDKPFQLEIARAELEARPGASAA